MTEHPVHREVDAQDVFDLADKLGDVVTGIKEVTGYGHKTRVLVRLLAISLVLDIALTLTVTLLTFNALNRSGDIARAQISACETSRGDQLSVWRGLLQNFTPTHPNKLQQTKDSEFLRFVDQRLDPKRCVALYTPK